MNSDSDAKASQAYSELEEKLNVYSHLFGVFLGLIALFFLIKKALEMQSTVHVISFAIFGISLILLYTASARYHGESDPERRFKLKVFDHSAIYILIAGTYTPYALIALDGSSGYILFGVSWSMAAIGIILKVFFTGRYKLFSTLMYVCMGWMVVFFIKPLLIAFPIEGAYWLLAGGIAYTLGAVVYLIKGIKLNHAIFHIFVLAGSICHFVSIYFWL
jgi:hemolysin III